MFGVNSGLFRDHTIILFRSCFTLFVYVLPAYISLAQEAQTIEGYISDTFGKPLQYAVIFVESNNTIYSFCQSDSLGYYRLAINAPVEEHAYLVVRLLGYNEVRYSFREVIGKSAKRFDVVLHERVEQLDEIIVRSNAAGVFFNDTTTIHIQTNSVEKQTIEDIIRQLPGFSVDDDGNIGYKGKQIKKVFLEGADLTAANYKRITRNMLAENVAKIDIIEHFVENQLLGGIVHSNEVVLNLSIDSLKKSRPFGNVDVNVGNSYYRHLVGNGFRVNKLHKISIQASTNNVGKRQDGEASSLLRELNTDVFSFDVLNTPVLEYTLNLPGSIGNANINNEHYFGLAGAVGSKKQNFLWNYDMSFLSDKRRVMQKDSLSVRPDQDVDSRFNWWADNSIRNAIQNVYARNRIMWRINSANQLDISLYFNRSLSDTRSLFRQIIQSSNINEADSVEKFSHASFMETQAYAEFTSKLSTNKAFLINLAVGGNKYPQHLSLFSNLKRFTLPFVLQDTFQVINQNLVNQSEQVIARMKFVSLVNRLSYEIFNEVSYSKAYFSPVIYNTDFADTNQLSVNRFFNELGGRTAFRWKGVFLENVLSGRLFRFTHQGYYFFPYLNTSISASVSKYSKWSFQLLYTRNFPEIHQVTSFYYLTDFNWINAGLGSIRSRKNLLLTTSYTYENLSKFWKADFTSGARFFYPDFVSSTEVTPLLSYQQISASQSTKLEFLQLKIEKFIPALNIRLASGMEGNRLFFYNYVNTTGLRNNKITTLNLSLETGTSFAIPVNFFITARISKIQAETHFENTQTTINNANSISQIRFALQYKCRNVTGRMIWQRFWLAGLMYDQVDGSLFYRPSARPFTLSVNFQNLTNQKFLYQFTQTDLYYSRTGYSLLPAICLLGLNWLF